jgi:hypothetical protein
LKQAMDARLASLGHLTLRQLSIDSDVVIETIRTWRAGTRTPYASKAARVEDRLFWERGSIRAILDGGEPRPLPITSRNADAAPEGNPISQIRSLDLLTREEQDRAIEQIQAALARAVSMQQRRAERQDSA